MVASILTHKTRAVWIFFPLLWWFFSGAISFDYSVERRQPVVYAQIDPSVGVTEEDLPPEEFSPDIPAASGEADPMTPQPAPLDRGSQASPESAHPLVHIPLSPQDVVALRFVEEGKGLLEKEEVEQAQERFEKAVAIAPQQPYSYYFLGQVSFAQDEHKQALAFLQKAELLFGVNDQPWRGETACLKGAIYEDLGDESQARTAYRQCLDFFPQNLRALSALARLPAEEPLPSDYFPQESPFYPRD
jgi:hypothetical protein